jgi:hypothetical protein
VIIAQPVEVIQAELTNALTPSSPTPAPAKAALLLCSYSSSISFLLIAMYASSSAFCAFEGSRAQVSIVHSGCEENWARSFLCGANRASGGSSELVEDGRDEEERDERALGDGLGQFVQHVGVGGVLVDLIVRPDVP